MFSDKRKYIQNVKQFQFREWTSEVPDQTGDAILDLIGRLTLNAEQRENPTTVMVHCA